QREEKNVLDHATHGQARQEGSHRREYDDRYERDHHEEGRPAAGVERRLGARVRDDEGLAGLVGADRLVLGAVVLENAADLGKAPNQEQVADDDRQLEAARQRLKERRPEVEREAARAVRERRRGLRKHHENQDREQNGERRQDAPAAAFRSASRGRVRTV